MIALRNLMKPNERWRGERVGGYIKGVSSIPLGNCSTFSGFEVLGSEFGAREKF